MQRRKFIKTSVALATISVTSGAVAFAQKEEMQTLTSRTSNPALKTIFLRKNLRKMILGRCLW
jgi:hypothetical protein